AIAMRPGKRRDRRAMPLVAVLVMKTNETDDGVTHRHCHGGDSGWVLGVAVGVVSVGRSTVRRDFSSFDFAFRRSRDPSLRQSTRQKLFGSPSSPPLPASASRAQVSGFFVFFPQT